MPTLKDVAARAGVSVATVSYCINGTHNLTPETRARVNQAIAELNYIPNSQARDLKRRTCREICAIFPDLENLCYSEFLKGILMQAENMDYSLNISCSYNDISKEQTLIKNAISKNYAGILLVTCQPQNTAFFRDVLYKHHMPVVFLDRMPSKIDAVYFGFNNYSTLFFLTQQLILGGFEDIALLTGPDHFFSESECIAGYQEAMDAAGLPIKDKRQLTSDTTKDSAFSSFLHVWADNPPQAIITTSQTLCQGVIEACNLTMHRIPEDICIITLDVDNWNRSSFYPNIIRTTRPAYAMGTQSCQALIDLAECSAKPENRFHLLQDTISSYPLSLPRPRSREAVPPRPAVAALKIAAADLPTIHAIKAISHEFYKTFQIQLNFDILELKDLFALILEDSQREHPRYDLYLYDTSWFSYLLHTNCLKDITDDFYTSPEIARYFVQKNLANCCFKNRYYGFPIIGGTQFLLYRKDLFSDPKLCLKYKQDHKISLRPPKTWKEFNSIARFFTREYNPDSPTIYGTGIATELNEELALEFEPRMWGHGGSFYDSQGRLCMNTPCNISAVASFMESFRYSQKGLFSNQSVFSEFSKGNLAMILTFTEYATQIQSGSHSEYLHRNGYSMIPGRIPTNVGWHFGVPRRASQLERTLNFFHWLLQRYTSYYMSILGGSSTLQYPYKNHELLKMYPWIQLTPDSIDSCLSRSYPLRKKSGYMAPNEFEAILCDQLRTMPQSPQEISDCLNRIQEQILQALAR
ncbi:MAG: extracellular solute-binding protein [Candidatus Limivivens sp.]|nr:extracellular solute-binding protein [Candidatus Limivivens sp.]